MQRRQLKWTKIEQSSRRLAALEKQKLKRKSNVDSVRHEDEPEVDNHCINDQSASKFTAQQPEWMYEIPDDLYSGEWIAVSRPEGRRCIIRAAHGKSTAFFENSKAIIFQSILPAGSRNSFDQLGKKTLVDAVYNPNEKVYYVLDVIMWKDFDLSQSSAEFRFYWLQSQFAQIESESVSQPARHQLVVAPRNIVDAQLGYRIRNTIIPLDGILFYHKHGQYAENETTPLVLLWKDERICSYWRDQISNIGLTLYLESIDTNAIVFKTSENVRLSVNRSQVVSNEQTVNLFANIGEVVKVNINLGPALREEEIDIWRLESLLQITGIVTGRKQSCDSMSKLLFLFGALSSKLTSPYQWPTEDGMVE